VSEPNFTVGPPRPVTDARQLPAVDAETELGFVSGADLGAEHPDNDDASDDAPVQGVGDTDLPSETELAELVSDVDTDTIDGVGFDGEAFADAGTGGS
jgi:hypothetical protein